MMPVLIILLGIALLVLSYWAHLRMRALKKASLSWPTTPGTIAAATYQTRENGTAETGKTQYTVFCADYTYAVAGAAHKGHWESGQTKRFPELVAKYKPGSTTLVHYDPTHPARTTLEAQLTGSSTIGILGLIFGIIALVLGLMMLLPQ